MSRFSNASRSSRLSIMTLLLVTLAAGGARAQYEGLDTTSVQGSPDPLPPLEIVDAFPHLKFSRPVGMTHAGDGSGRVFVIDQIGVIHVFQNSPDTKESKVFLDIQKKTLTEHFEEGLLGLAFHPQYRENGQFFVYYSSAKPRRSVISRFTVSKDDPDRADPGSEEVVLEVEQPYGNHNSGSIEFGIDGKLYIPLGDGGAGGDPHGNGQKLDTMLGKILRIDIDKKDEGKNYAVPSDNPFVGREGALPEIWVYGVRNPWRLTFDRLTGEGWFADVGQSQREEVNLLKKGANYGWKVREGELPFAPDAETTGEAFTAPLITYGRHDGKSITGGLVYRGQEFPELKGAYLYGDFASFNLWALKKSGASVTSNLLISRGKLPVTGYGEDEQGEVVIAAFGAGDDTDLVKVGMGKLFHLGNGRLYRFRRRTDDLNDPDRFPRLLSQTGFFTDTKNLVPSEGLIGYSVNVPQWTDGARQERYFALPPGGKIGFSENGNWEFPVGSVFLQHLALGPRKLETRLLVLSDRGWDAYTYRWNEDGSDAKLLEEAASETLATAHAGEKSWHFPGRSDCNTCHNQSSGYVLGVNTRQLNRSFANAPELNQIETLTRLGIFEKAPEKPAGELSAFPSWDSAVGSVDSLARAYLDVNCSICHRPGGTAVSRADFRASARLDKARFVGQDPGQVRLGAPGSKVAMPGQASRSELVLRMMHLGTGRMPPVASSSVDWKAVGIVGQWIESLKTR